MNKTVYDKPYMDGHALATKLMDEGLCIPSLKTAKLVIENVSYYRFKAYCIPFRVDPVHKGCTNKFCAYPNGKSHFKHGIDFQMVFNLYQFDCKLKSLIFEYISHIEVATRSRLDQFMTKRTGTKFWYIDSKSFKPNKHDEIVNTVNELRGQFRRSKEEYSEHYKQKYVNDFCPLFADLPPGWVAIELMTFGNVQKLLTNINTQGNEDIMNEFAASLGTKNYQQLKNWLEGIRQVRNHCAHHSRLFNQNIQAFQGIKKRLSKKIPLVQTLGDNGKAQVDQLNRLYTAVAAIQTINNHIAFDKGLGRRIKDLMTEHDVPQYIQRSMGFPTNWDSDPIFNQ